MKGNIIIVLLLIVIAGVGFIIWEAFLHPSDDRVEYGGNYTYEGDLITDWGMKAQLSDDAKDIRWLEHLQSIRSHTDTECIGLIGLLDQYAKVFVGMELRSAQFYWISRCLEVDWATLPWRWVEANTYLTHNGPPEDHLPYLHQGEGGADHLGERASQALTREKRRNPDADELFIEEHGLIEIDPIQQQLEQEAQELDQLSQSFPQQGTVGLGEIVQSWEFLSKEERKQIIQSMVNNYNALDPEKKAAVDGLADEMGTMTRNEQIEVLNHIFTSSALLEWARQQEVTPEENNEK